MMSFLLCSDAAGVPERVPKEGAYQERNSARIRLFRRGDRILGRAERSDRTWRGRMNKKSKVALKKRRKKKGKKISLRY
jgi:hypothetical protein